MDTEEKQELPKEGGESQVAVAQVAEPKAETPKIPPAPPATTEKPVPEEDSPRYKSLAGQLRKEQQERQALEARLREQENLRAEVSATRAELAVISEILAEPQGEEESLLIETPKPSRAVRIQAARDRVLEKQKQEEVSRQAWGAWESRKRQEADGILTRANLTWDDPKVIEALKGVTERDWDGVVTRINNLAWEVREATKPNPEEIQATVAEKVKEELTKRGLLESETSTGGPLSTFAQIEDAWAKGEISYTKYAEALAKHQQR